ncbi:HPP family protein [Thiomicrospira sp. WB1]|uniref:HPP family protein n=1 Tax=Thiomicrospira sp. WB1 TaxID=1685380 RepID=UPI0007471E50|nr:HPP family protein [Thiomicrospira sp. WB1]KUJ72373.1 hypothetical protein AVO41_00725 [Thiomicrospira sp. WB1]
MTQSTETGKLLRHWQQTLGLSAPQWTEALISVLGVALAVSVLSWGMSVWYPNDWPWLLIASLGASSIIVFASPHAPMAQPWSLIMGQLLSGLSGLASWHWFQDPVWAVPVGVTGAILAMLIFQCRHAPGGATAMYFASGAPVVQSLDWALIWGYLLPGLVVLALLGVLYNAPFRWRRYPLIWGQKALEAQTRPCDSDRLSDRDKAWAQQELTHEDLVYAQSRLRHYFEMNEAEFMALYRLARTHHRQGKDKPVGTEDTDPD